MKRMMAAAVAGLVSLGLSTGAVLAQAFPSKPITLVVPFAPGGPTDIVARVIAARMGETLGQTVVVDNVAGAAGTIGAAKVARSAKDGYTLLMGPMSTMSFSPALYPESGFDPIKDFEPVGLVASAPILLVASKKAPVTTIAELKDQAKTQGFANGNAGVGSTSHLACLLLNQKLGINPLMAAYRGSGPAIQDLVSGQVHYICDQVTSLTSHVAGGTVTPIAIMASTRSPALPNVPTAAEVGVQGVDMLVWNGVFAPKGTPADVIDKLNDAIVKGLDRPESQERFKSLSAEAPVGDARKPAALGKMLAADVEKWGGLIKAAGIKVNP
ncbi:MAG: tripartite tricarboxylate transporter substrate binding protein [Proteobacteria bacterium]|nr:tripartite tricarboxylate transporter substrate binding protein [Pseudomonadota bacterium]